MGIAAAAGPRNLPGQWALSCLFFALCLETSRHLSPTRRLLDSWADGIEASTNPEQSTAEVVEDSWYAPFVASCGDYALGGAVAGLAGARARAASGGRSVAGGGSRLGWGLRVGGSLGLLAGLFEGSASVAQRALRNRDDRDGDEGAGDKGDVGDDSNGTDQPLPVNDTRGPSSTA